jgi:hypothetical protein
MRRLRFTPHLLSTLVVVATLGSASDAFAFGGNRLALDLDFTGAIDETGVGAGTGGALRFGRKFDLMVLSLTPEIGGSYHTFSGSAEASEYSGFLGARLGFGKILEPGVFAHGGVAHLSAWGIDDTAPAVDAGVFLDLTLLPILDIGVHAAYNAILPDGGEAFDWYRLGAHVALGF